MALFPILTSNGSTIVTSSGFASVIDVSSGPPVTTGTTIVVPDADLDFWGAELTAAAGGISSFNQAIPPSEWGDFLPSGGHVALNPKPTATDVKIYDPTTNWALIATIPAMLGNKTTEQQIKANPASNSFYYGGTTGSSVTTLHRSDAAGTLFGTSWTLPANSAHLVAMAITPDDSTVYYSSLASGNAIHAYNLNSSSALPDFVAAGAHVAQDLLMLANGELLIAYQGTSNQGVLVDSGGSTIRTYTFPGNDLHRVAREGTNDPASFWTWQQLNAQQSSLFQQINVADGSILATIPAPIYIVGVLNQTTDSTPQVFGTSNTCPLLVLELEVPVPMQTFPIRRQRKFMV